MKRRSLIAAAAVIAVVAVAGLAEPVARHVYRAANTADPKINQFVLYDKGVVRQPGATLNFAFYSKNGVLLQAAPKLNNLGYFSERDYDPAGAEGVFRIVVLGGEQTASSTVTRSWPDFLEDELGPDFRVYNLAWPDAGPTHYIEYWKNAGVKFRPDLVLVNFLESDFYKVATESKSYVKYLGKKIAGSAVALYELPAGAARMVPAYVDGARLGPPPTAGHWQGPQPVVSLRDPNVIPSRPYGVFLPAAAIKDPASLEHLRRTVVDDMVTGAIGVYGCIACAWVAGELRPVHELRNFEVIQLGKSISRERVVEFGTEKFGWMARHIPNVVFLHNYTLGTAPYDISDAVAAAEPAFSYVDMRNWAPKGATPDEARSWTLHPIMTEKWSEKGMKVYAGMIARALRDRRLSKLSER